MYSPLVIFIRVDLDWWVFFSRTSFQRYTRLRGPRPGQWPEDLMEDSRSGHRYRGTLFRTEFAVTDANKTENKTKQDKLGPTQLYPRAFFLILQTCLRACEYPQLESSNAYPQQEPNKSIPHTLAAFPQCSYGSQGCRPFSPFPPPHFELY